MAVSQKTKILMVDDDRFLLDIYKTYFEKEGYDVASFHDADDALQALRTGYDPQVILFDITMPESKSGYEFIDVVKRESLGKKSLKIALTNEGQDGAIARTKELGADEHLLKAKYVPSELVAKVTEFLAKHPKKSFSFFNL
jgi:CheY-like chemotaxis protein